MARDSRVPSAERSSHRRDVEANLFGLGIAGTSGILLLLLIAAVHGPETLGRFNLLFAVYLVGAQIATLGLHTSVVRHLALNAAGGAAGRSVLRGALLAILASAGVVALGLWALRASLAGAIGRPELARSLAVVAVGVLLFSINKVLLAALTAYGRMRLHALLTAGRGLLMLIALLVLTWLGLGGEDLFLVLVIAEAVLLVSLVASLGSELFARGWDRACADWAMTHLKFGFRGAGTSMLSELNVRVDVLVLSVFVDDKAIGVYTVAATLAEAVLQFPAVYRTVLSPTIVSLLSASRQSELSILVRRTRAQLWLRTTSLSLGVAAVYYFATIVFSRSSGYVDGLVPLVILLAGVSIASGYVPFSFALAQGGSPGNQTLLGILLFVMNVLGNVLLVPTLGLIGAAASTALVNMCSVPLLRYRVKTVLLIHM